MARRRGQPRSAVFQIGRHAGAASILRGVSLVELALLAGGEVELAGAQHPSLL
ncbi:MAG: hypothetical protein M1522_09545 [Actinobacteria bacterium]|nr:hypothetical protein [Actinomycetota bacterium]